MKMFCIIGLAMVLALIQIDTVHSLKVSITGQEMKYLERGEYFVGKVVFKVMARSGMDCIIRYRRVHGKPCQNRPICFTQLDFSLQAFKGPGRFKASIMLFGGTGSSKHVFVRLIEIATR